MENQIRIYATGLSFPKDGSYDLRTLEIFVTNYRVILDRLVSVHLGRRQVPKDLKRRISYKVKKIRDQLSYLLIFFTSTKS